jgi:hypothetical protein
LNIVFGGFSIANVTVTSNFFTTYIHRNLTSFAPDKMVMTVASGPALIEAFIFPLNLLSMQTGKSSCCYCFISAVIIPYIFHIISSITIFNAKFLKICSKRPRKKSNSLHSYRTWKILCLRKNKKSTFATKVSLIKLWCVSIK